VGVILNAMGADYYPRLTAVASDDAAVNRMVNEQTEMGLLLAIPGILATLALAPYVLHVFYSAEFLPATDIIRWQILGVALRVVSWPLGFVILAKGRSRLFIFAEVVTAILQVVLTLVCMRVWGLEGIGLSFMFLYLVHVFFIFFIICRLSGFVWTKRSWWLIATGVTACAVTLAAVRFLPSLPALLVGLLLASVSIFISASLLKRMLGIDFSQMIRRRLKMMKK